MNQRIQELYKQAHVSETKKVRKGGWDNDREPFEYSSVTTTVFNPEKFAQLIVQECAEILMKPEYAMNHPEEHSDYNKRWVNGRLLGIEHIKEHFGVEK